LSSFTHHDPLEDTESALPNALQRQWGSFTHHDPLEDTERRGPSQELLTVEKCFTHHDPLEDTERVIGEMQTIGQR